jgi:myo-inositol-1-phosphate synthase
MTKQTLKKNLASIGEEISHELGIKMVKDYQIANPNDVTNYQIGRNIIETVLAQPGCVAIRFYNAINELGQKTLVYVAVNENDEVIAEYVTINNHGELSKQKAIVADRARPGTRIDSEEDTNTTWGFPE